MAQLNITLNQEEIPDLFSKDHDQVFRNLIQAAQSTSLALTEVGKITKDQKIIGRLNRTA